MTANQINYAKHLEDVRTHRATEEISGRQAAAAERQAGAAEAQAMSSASQAETAIKNSESNLINAYANQTNAAANWQNAKTNVLAQQEDVRHNKASEINELVKAQKSYEGTVYSADTSASNTLLTTGTQHATAELNARAGIIDTLIKAVGGMVQPFSAGWKAAGQAGKVAKAVTTAIK